MVDNRNIAVIQARGRLFEVISGVVKLKRRFMPKMEVTYLKDGVVSDLFKFFFALSIRSLSIVSFYLFFLFSVPMEFCKYLIKFATKVLYSKYFLTQKG